MSICMTGVDHNKANLDIRSVFSLTSKRKALAYETFLDMDGVEGCVMITTCNRTELWFSLKDNVEFSPFQVLCNYLKVNAEDYCAYFEEREDSAAVDHLFRLAAGLESKIIGEDQILTQVGDAVTFARSCYATDNTLEVLFRKAVTAGKRVHTETSLSTADHSVADTALRMLEEEGIPVNGKKCMVIGNGMMGRLSAEALMKRGADVTVTVRKYHSGVVEIPFGCDRIGYENRFELLPQCDLVVSATTSPNYTIMKSLLDGMSPSHFITMVDLAVPRDIEPEVKELPWVRLYDIDCFHIDIKSEKFKANLLKAEKILEEEKNDFYTWYEGRDFVPLIQTLKGKAGTDVSARMKPVFKRISLDDAEKNNLIQEIEGASARMMNHLLFGMRTKMSDKVFREMLDAMTEVLETDR